MKCAWCHGKIVDENDSRKVNDEFDVHWWCVDWMDTKVKRIKDDEGRRAMVLQFLKRMSVAVVVVAVIAVCAAVAFGEDRVVIPESKAKRACTFVIGFHSGDFSVFYEKILVVAEKPALDENGNPTPEWWVVSRQNPNHRDAEGKEIAYNVPKDQVLFVNPQDGPVVVMHKMRKCQCPPMFWGGGSSGISAEQ